MGRTPLSYAAEKGHTDVACILLARQEVDPKRADRNDMSPPLSYAVVSGGPDTACNSGNLNSVFGIGIGSCVSKLSHTPINKEMS